MPEKREARVVSRTGGAAGTSTTLVRCPYCRRDVRVNARGLFGKGKRCSCGALIKADKIGQAYAYKER